MSALTRFLELKMYFIILFLLLFAHRYETDVIDDFEHKAMNWLSDFIQDIVKTTYTHLESVEPIKQKNLNTPSFEIGYLMFNTFEAYRKMLDLYNTSTFMSHGMYQMEILLYLNDIENLYWEIEHFTNMLHEIERKYNQTTSLHSKFHELTSAEKYGKYPVNPYKIPRGTRSIKIRQKVLDRLKGTPKKIRSTRFPQEYGWDYPDPEEYSRTELVTTVKNKPCDVWPRRGGVSACKDGSPSKDKPRQA